MADQVAHVVVHMTNQQHFFGNMPKEFPSGKVLRWDKGLAKHENGVMFLKFEDESYFRNIQGEDLIWTFTLRVWEDDNYDS